MAAGAGVVLREAGERTVGVENVARFAIRSPGLFGVRLVQEIDGLRLMRIKNPGENDPTGNQGKSKSKGEDEKIPFHMWSFGTQFLVEKKCWNTHTSC